MDSIYKLKGVIQHYNWGGTQFIPHLLKLENPDQKPFAEYWLGAHPNAAAMVTEENISLHQLITQSPIEILGESTAHKFGSLPYLFKILDVRQMLSIQVHPSKESAAEEFENENKRGISITAPNRNYKDKNHKPELMVALSDFWLLHGFKNKEETEAVLQSVSELSFLLSLFQSKGYESLYEEVMTMPQRKVDEVLSPLLKKMIPLYQAGRLQKDDENFWAARAALTYCKNECYDRGIFSIYLFNLLHLKEGEAIYQPAGLPHAYLEGQNVEVMANSDNVLRAGLTDKHVDVPELMKHVKFEATYPKIIRASSEAEQSFDAPVKEFCLKRYSIHQTVELLLTSATIFFVYDGQGQLTSEGKTVDIKEGEAVIGFAGKKIIIEPAHHITIFSVTTPEDKN